MGHIRPRTKFSQQVRSRRCGKCGAKVNSLAKRCKRCSKVLARPKK